MNPAGNESSSGGKKEHRRDDTVVALPTQGESAQLIALFNAGDLAELERQAGAMLERHPESGFLWKIYALGLRRQGKECLQALQKASQLSPDDSELHFNLGNVCHEQGRMGEAERSFLIVVRLMPNFAEAHFSLARVYYAQGKFMLALDSTIRSLRLKETPANRSFFVTCVKHRQFGVNAQFVRDNLVRALTEPWGRPGELAETCAFLVKRNPVIEQCVMLALTALPQPLTPQALSQQVNMAAIADDRLLCALIGVTPVCDVELERLLTTCRQVLLDEALVAQPATPVNGQTLAFYAALARQCFVNEYVFALTSSEQERAGVLRDALVAALDEGAEISMLLPLAVAAYFPLHTLPEADRLLQRNWPGPVQDVLQLQVLEPMQELQGRADIPRLTAIEDEVSLLVQSQYEENPYPRWIAMAPPGIPMTIDAMIRRLFPFVAFKPIGERPSPNLLVAGCGTGQHSIEAHRKFIGAKTLAIDLSLSSLAYARRKTQEMGVTGIEYAQADIMKLGALERRFDVIESCGVLHHLADPWAGWHVLLSLLRPGGFMKLGFYSELARRNIVRSRAFIAERGYGSTPSEIRRCRQDMLAMTGDEGIARMTRVTDFFSTSDCRDLLFHVQEHRMTLPEIGAFLQENSLAFLGFDIRPDYLHAYKQRFPDDVAATNLSQWHVFECENPDTFIGMYNFWVQKTA